MFEFGSGILPINEVELSVELEMISFVWYYYVNSKSFFSILFFLLLLFSLIDVLFAFFVMQKVH